MFKNSDIFSNLFVWLFVCLYFLSRENPNCYLYPIKFLTLNTTTVTRDNEVLSDLNPSSNVRMCVIYTKFRYLVGR